MAHGAWRASAFCVVLVLAAVNLASFGAGESGTRLPLRLTARPSHGLFWLANAGAVLVTVFGPVFQPVASRGRELGMAFASAHRQHVALVSWLDYIFPRPPVGRATLLYFSIAVVITYLLALLSFRRIAALLPAAL